MIPVIALRSLALALPLLAPLAFSGTVLAAGETGSADKDLLAASVANNAKAIHDLLENGADPNVEFENGVTPLINVAALGNDRAIQMLLRAGARIDEDGRNGCTPLTWAARNGWDKTVALLLDNGADIDHRDLGGMTPLMRAAWNGQTDAVRTLVERGADFQTLDKNGHSALTFALAGVHPKVEEVLRNAGATDPVGSAEEAKRKVAEVPFVLCVTPPKSGSRKVEPQRTTG